MRFAFNKILIILFLSSYSVLNLSGENDSTRYIGIITQVNSMLKDNKNDEAISILRKNKKLFQIDEMSQFSYNLLNGTILYKAEKYSEARPYIADAIPFLEAYQNELSDLNLTRFLRIYYDITDIDNKLGATKDVLIKELEHAKYIYEIAGATSDTVYSWITSDLKSIKENNLDVTMDALNLFMAGDDTQAIPLLHNVIDYYRTNRATDYIGLANWMKLLGMAYMNIGDYNNSEKTYISVKELLESKKLKNEKAYRMVLDALSVLYIQLQNYEKALMFNTEAKTLYEQAPDFGDEYVLCVNNCALCHKALGYNTTAKIMLNVALRQAKQNLSDTTAISTSLKGLNLFTNRQLDAKTMDNNYYIQTRIIPYITLLSNSAAVYADLGYFSDAVRTIKEAIKVSEEYGLKEALPYNNLGMLYFSKSKFSQSVEWFLKSYELCKTPYESDEIGMNTALGLYFSKNAATSTFCSKISEIMRKNIQGMFAFMSGKERGIYWKHFENYLPLLNLIIYEGGDLNVFGTIYDNILEAKGLLLKATNEIRDAILNSSNKDDIADFNKIGQLKQQLLNEKDNEKRTVIEREIEFIDKKLTQHVNTYKDFTSSKSINWKDIRDALSKDEAAIEFYNIPVVWGLDSIQKMNSAPRYCAVILRKGYEFPHIISLCRESQLVELDKEELYETDSIYNLIWKPLEEELNGVRNIYFAADRELHKIGIEYAPMTNGGIIEDKYNLYRLSSTRVLGEKRMERKANNAVLYGGLRYDIDKDDLVAESRSGDYHPTSASRAFTMENNRYGVKYLPGTLKEVEDISKNFNKKPLLVTGISGTEESFKSLTGIPIDIIHLATHGFFWNQDDTNKRNYVTFLNNMPNLKSEEDKALTRSGLFFSGANVGLRGESLPDDVEDGILTALELSNMNLGHVDMVVMSTCDSGLGETSGEGIFGLQRGFKLAGANTLLMSLWKVDDTATQLLMTNFYKNYLSGKPKQESLKLAQQSLRRNSEYSAPEYWAAFILLDGLN